MKFSDTLSNKKSNIGTYNNIINILLHKFGYNTFMKIYLLYSSHYAASELAKTSIAVKMQLKTNIPLEQQKKQNICIHIGNISKILLDRSG